MELMTKRKFCKLHEVYYIGSCKLCNELTYDQLWIAAVSAIIDFVQWEGFGNAVVGNIKKHIFSLPAIEAYLRDCEGLELELRKYKIREAAGQWVKDYLQRVTE